MLMATIFLFSSCASIVSENTYSLTINSSPSDAKISITDKKGYEVFIGNTPVVVQLKAGSGFFSKAEYHVKFSTPGYDVQIIPVTFSLDGWYFGNILFGGLIILIIIGVVLCTMYRSIDPVNFGDPLVSIYSGFRILALKVGMKYPMLWLKIHHI